MSSSEGEFGWHAVAWRSRRVRIRQSHSRTRVFRWERKQKCPDFFWIDTEPPSRDAVGDSSVAGDTRWAGTYGVNVDFVARSHCSVVYIPVSDIQASGQPQVTAMWPALECSGRR